MAKFQLARVQREPPRGIGFRAVLAIAGDRMAKRGQLNADLVAASGLERKLEQRSVSFRAKHAVVGDRQLAALFDATGTINDLVSTSLSLSVPCASAGTPSTTARYLLMTPFQFRCSAACADSVLANIMRPEVSRSSRWTMKTCCAGVFMSAFRCVLRIRYAVFSFSRSEPIESSPARFLDHDDGIIQMHDCESVAFKRPRR